MKLRVEITMDSMYLRGIDIIHDKTNNTDYAAGFYPAMVRIEHRNMESLLKLVLNLKVSGNGQYKPRGTL